MNLTGRFDLGCGGPERLEARHDGARATCLFELNAEAVNVGSITFERSALTAMVFFDYDQSTIRDDSKTVLDQKIVLLRANPGVALRIEGHADERGSVEYNLALSLRRANAIKDYLTNFGLDGSRFEVAAMGEERPLESGASETAYARNRRGEFYITRGGDNLVSGR